MRVTHNCLEVQLQNRHAFPLLSVSKPAFTLHRHTVKKILCFSFSTFKKIPIQHWYTFGLCVPERTPGFEALVNSRHVCKLCLPHFCWILSRFVCDLFLYLWYSARQDHAIPRCLWRGARITRCVTVVQKPCTLSLSSPYIGKSSHPLFYNSTYAHTV